MSLIFPPLDRWGLTGRSELVAVQRREHGFTARLCSCATCFNCCPCLLCFPLRLLFSFSLSLSLSLFFSAVRVLPFSLVCHSALTSTLLLPLCACSICSSLRSIRFFSEKTRRDATLSPTAVSWMTLQEALSGSSVPVARLLDSCAVMGHLHAQPVRHLCALSARRHTTALACAWQHLDRVGRRDWRGSPHRRDDHQR